MEWDVIRPRRNNLLAASDWTQLPDAPLNDEQRSAWKLYRDTLRDLPEIFSEPATIIWPEQPKSDNLS